MLYFNACDFGPRDATRPGVQAGLWGSIFWTTPRRLTRPWP